MCVCPYKYIYVTTLESAQDSYLIAYIGLANIWVPLSAYHTMNLIPIYANSPPFHRVSS